MKHSKGKARNAAQMSSSIQSGSGTEQEMESPLHNSRLEQLLKARQVSVNNRELLIAAGQGDLRKAENLIQEGSVDVDFADRDGNTALHYAVESSNLEIINRLIENNAKIDIENEQCETAFDVAVRLKREAIIQEFEEKIVHEAYKILENAQKATETTSTAKKIENMEDTKKPTESTSTFSQESNVDQEEQDEDIKETEKKINGLLQLLKPDKPVEKKDEQAEKKDEPAEKKDEPAEKKDELGEEKDDYKKAMIFILFLETFAFQGGGKKKGPEKRDELRKHFFSSEEEKESKAKKRKAKKSKSKESKINVNENSIEGYRSLVLKNPEKNYVFNDINSVIKKQNVDFFKNLEKQLSQYVEKRIKMDIKVLLTELDFSPKKVNADESSKVPNSDSHDTYVKLIDLVNEIYQKNADLYKLWFEFIVNIYPKLEKELQLEVDTESFILRKEIKHLRNNLIHSFYEYGVFEFREAVFNLRGKLVEYSYSNQVYQDIIKPLIDKTPAEIENELKEQLEEVKEKFIATDELFSKEVDQPFGYRVEKILSPLANKLSQQITLRGLVKDYWRYVLPIDLVDPENFSNNEFEDKNDLKKLNGVSRRKLFEKFIALKRHKLIIPDSYYEAKEKLKKEVIEYGCSPLCFDQICRRNVEDNEELDEEMLEIVENILKFISITHNAKEILDRREDSFISFARDILEVQDEHVKKLVLTQTKSIHRMKKELEGKVESSEKIRQLMELKKYFRKIPIEEKEGSIKIIGKEQLEQNKKVKKVTDAVINIVETLFNAYNKYKVDFNLKEIFSSRNFLNELVDKIKDNNVPTIIDRLIDIDYMSPLVSSLIVKQSKKESKKTVTNHIILEKLIDNMLAVKEYADYLKDLLQVNCYKFNFYKKFYNKILEKHIDIQDISSIFKEPNNIKEFIGVLVSDMENVFKEPNAVMEKKDQIMKLVMSLLEIINKEIADEYYYKKNYLSQVIEDSKKLYNLKKEIGRAYPQFSGFVDMSILEARIKNKKEEFEEALNILIKLEKELENNYSLKANYLLTLSDIAYTYKLLKNNEMAQSKYSLLYHEIINYCIKFDTKVRKADYQLYSEIKDLNEYKILLQHSELLHSEKHLNILNIFLDIAYILLKSGKKEEALEIYKKVYKFRKEESVDRGSNHNKTIQVLGYIASTNRDIGYIYNENEQFSDALPYLLSALLQSSIVYNFRKELLGENHEYLEKTAGQIVKTLKQLAYRNNKLGFTQISKKWLPKSRLTILKQSLEHYRKAEEILNKVLTYQIRILGEGNAETEKTKNNRNCTVDWKNRAIDEINKKTYRL